jgi:GTPase Era involved in 16S rRNA processing
MANRERFLEKLDSYGECVQAIGKEAHGIIDPDTRGKLTELQRNIRDLHERIKGNRFEIAIVGLEKAGKSTFANALIGFDILPTKEERCTYTSSCVKYAESTYAEVEFFTQEEFNERFISNLRRLGAGDDASYSYGNFTESQLAKLIDGKALEPADRNVAEDVTDMIKSYSDVSYLLGQPPRKYTEDELDKPEFMNLIQNPDRAADGRYVQKPTFAVKAITIYSNKLGNMKNIVVYDVPGFDSPTAIHIEQTKLRMDAADAIILIANANRPSLTGPQLQIFRKSTDSDGVAFNDKIFVFANRADESKELNSNMGRLGDELDKFGILRKSNYARLIAGSAWVHLQLQKADETKRDMQAIENLKRNGTSAGIDEINGKLRDYNDNERTRILEKRVRNIETRIRNIFDEIEGKIEGDGFAGADENSAEFLKEHAKARRAFEDSLLDYRPEFRGLLNTLPLTQGILKALETNLRPEALFPTPEEIEKQKKRALQGVGDFEIALRKQEHPKIKGMFDAIVSGKSDALEEDVRINLTKRLVEALGVTSAHRYYEEIEEISRAYVDEYFSSFDFELIYKALSLRFSREILEILIHLAYLSDDRLDYFNNNRANIISLALYAREAQERIRVNTPIYPDDLPLVNKILFHENPQVAVSDEAKADCVAESAAIIKSKITHQHIPVKDYAEAVVAWAVDSGVPLNILLSTIRTTMPDIKSKEYAEDKEKEAIKHHLNEVVEKLKPTITADSASAKSGDGKYIPLSERYASAKSRRENTHEWVVARYCEDVRILTEVIRESVVNAFKLEVPFVENITEVIDKMKRDTDDDRFRKFFASVRSKVEYERFEELETLQKRNAEKREILDSISKIKENLGG